MRLLQSAFQISVIVLVACGGTSLDTTAGGSDMGRDGGAAMGGADAPLGGMGVSTGGGGGQTGPSTALEVCGAGADTSLGACLDGEDADGAALSDTDYARVEAHVRGTLEAISRDRVACEGRGLGWTRSDAFALELRHAGERQLRVIVDLPLAVELAEPGEQLELKYKREPWGSFHEGPPPLGSLELRSADGELLLWMGQSGQGPTALAPPDEITLSQGTLSCRDHVVSCQATHRSLHVRASGEVIEVAPRTSVPVGEYVVWLESNEEDFGCSGGHPFLVAVVRKR